MDDLFLMLVLAHLLGDFLLQPSRWIEERRQKKWKAGPLYLHGFVHIALAFGALWMAGFSVFWYLAFLIGGTHILIDPIKAFAKKKRLSFFLDQLIHLLVIALTTLVISNFNFPEISLGSVEWKVIVAFVFVTKPASILITQLLPDDWGPQPRSKEIKPSQDDNGLENAGEYIGILERLLILGFILTNNWSGIGFLLAAKSVFRFSDLQKAEQRKQTEYIMIGTLLSFSLAIVAGWWATF
ncbi:MAG: DUF3307 domain-containing protein [Gracilimonas sp.]|uniref:DUF3307 domain-containing protein n=1 Tax=Gracilimonas TaxID=649462 RepID=UPI001B0BC3FD|nr:DUF3307 domain-containing protein [Gracilimonas sp.]MBO6586258.1 DUF3307 domain-containing protein [Gracilimonas sp.]MBO6614915.1 DUF3307 domain-containing protein [Gracilimonas sp.]